MLGTLRPVSENERLFAVEACQRVIAAMDLELTPCSRDEGTTFVATLLSAYPAVLDRDRSEIAQREFGLYANRLFEAFSMFSAAVCHVIVHGGKGVPAKQKYKPQPSDIIAAGNAEVEKIRAVKTMAQRQIAEHERREKALAANKVIDMAKTPEARARIDAMIRDFKVQAMEAIRG